MKLQKIEFKKNSSNHNFLFIFKILHTCKELVHGRFQANCSTSGSACRSGLESYLEANQIRPRWCCKMWGWRYLDQPTGWWGRNHTWNIPNRTKITQGTKMNRFWLNWYKIFFLKQTKIWRQEERWIIWLDILHVTVLGTFFRFFYILATDKDTLITMFLGGKHEQKNCQSF